MFYLSIYPHKPVCNLYKYIFIICNTTVGKTEKKERDKKNKFKETQCMLSLNLHLQYIKVKGELLDRKVLREGGYWTVKLREGKGGYRSVKSREGGLLVCNVKGRELLDCKVKGRELLDFKVKGRELLDCKVKRRGVIGL